MWYAPFHLVPWPHLDEILACEGFVDVFIVLKLFSIVSAFKSVNTCYNTLQVPLQMQNWDIIHVL